VVFIGHPNKTSSERKAQYRPSGSYAGVAAARSTFYYEYHPDDMGLPKKERRRVIASSKTNLGPDPESWVYKIKPVKLDGPNRDQARVEYLKEPCTLTADDLCTGPKEPPRDSKLAQARSFVHEKLTPGPMLLRDFEGSAFAAEIAPATLKRAKQELQVVLDRTTHMVRLPEEL
jgi:hypothetical protein